MTADAERDPSTLTQTISRLKMDPFTEARVRVALADWESAYGAVPPAQLRATLESLALIHEEPGQVLPWLAAAAEKVATAEAQLRDARAVLTNHVRRAAIAGHAETVIASTAKINRGTVRRALGKQP